MSKCGNGGGRLPFVRAALVLATLLVLVGCREAEEAAPSENASPVEVRVAPVRRGDIADVLSVTGETQARTMLRLASPVAGRVTFLTAQAGDSLPARTVAARVIPLENEAALHGFAVLEDAGVLSASEKRRAGKLQRDLSRGEIALRAPFDAVVAARLRNPGEQVAANDVVLDLFDPRSLYVIAQIPIKAAARVHTGMPVEISAGGSKVKGHVAAVLTAMTPQTLTVPVRIELATVLQPPLLHAAVDCRITVERHASVLLIPRSALLSSNVGAEGTVLVAVDNHARHRTVALGLRNQSWVEVTGGLQEGDRVLVEGQYGLADGTPISPATGGGA
jgi:membrane fusion protein (multidrug efflux system)